ncbi:MAG: transglycosylase SLT domain-containing protein [candidate division Zixibacteria bacterium]|nr:transglycosylase SLT domain-containing protein [candidate division Zixibacteria bacterium]
MTAPIKAVGVSGNTDFSVEALRRPTNGTPEAEKARLRKATKEFESFFIYQMLKTMRGTIPEDSLAKDTPLSDGLGKDAFTEIFDMEIARKASFGGHNSIAELLYKSMEKLIDAKSTPRNPNPQLKPLRAPEPQHRELEKREMKPLPDNAPKAHELKRQPHSLPLSPRHPIVTSHDPIVANFGRMIDKAAQETGLDSALIRSVIQTESNGNPNAVSPSGAKGLMQLVDSTAQELCVKDPFDPDENIRAGSRYLKQMLDRFGDLKLALAAYNAGPGNVAKHGGMPPFDETRQYVERVTSRLGEIRSK